MGAKPIRTTSDGASEPEEPIDLLNEAVRHHVTSTDGELTRDAGEIRWCTTTAGTDAGQNGRVIVTDERLGFWT